MLCFINFFRINNASRAGSLYVGGGIFQTYCTPKLIRICLFAVFAISFLAILLPIFLFNEYNDAKNNECIKFGGTCIEKNSM